MAGAKRNAYIELSIKQGALETGLRAARKRLMGFASSTGKAAMGGLKGIGSALGTGFGIQGAGMISDMVGGVVDLERALTRLQINGSMTEGQMAKFRATLMDVSKATGVGRDKITEAASAYVAATGDAQGATEAMGLFADVNKATGASMADIASTAAALRTNLKIDPKDFRGAFDVLATQGKMGAVEIANLATELSNVAPMFARFGGGTGAAGLAQMGAVLQTMRKDFGSVEETATGFKAIMSQLMRNSGDLKKVGVNVFATDPKTKKKTVRNFLDIADEIGKKVNSGKLGPEKLIALLGEQKAVNALLAVIEKRGEVQDLATKAANSNAIAKDAMTYTESSAGKIDAAWNSIKTSIAEALTPERIANLSTALVRGADLFAALMDKVSGLAGALSDLFPGYDKAADKQQADMKSFLLEGKQNMPAAAKKQIAAKYREMAAAVPGQGATNDPDLAGKYFGYIEAAKTLEREARGAMTPEDSRQQRLKQDALGVMANQNLTQRAAYEEAAQKSIVRMEPFDYGRMAQAQTEAMSRVQINLSPEGVTRSAASSKTALLRPGGRI